MQEQNIEKGRKPKHNRLVCKKMHARKESNKQITVKQIQTLYK